MFYTTYFAKLRSIDKIIVPVAICAKPPVGYCGFKYTPLAPSYSILMEYKRGHDQSLFTSRYKTEILDHLSPYDVVDSLFLLTNVNRYESSESKIALVCFEKSTDFCHRHIVSSWLTENGFPVTELT